MQFLEVVMFRAILLTAAIGLGTASAYAEQPAACDPPYDPSNIVEVLFFYPGTINYLALGPEACRFAFAEEVRTVVRETGLFTEGCVKATLKDVDEALAGRYKGKPVIPFAEQPSYYPWEGMPREKK